jgi:hypothetical protein
MSVRYRCNQCLSPGCSSFFPQSTDPSKVCFFSIIFQAKPHYNQCYCGHSSMSHDPGPPAAEPIRRPSFPPRGGLGSCSEFRSVGNIQVCNAVRACQHLTYAFNSLDRGLFSTMYMRSALQRACANRICTSPVQHTGSATTQFTFCPQSAISCSFHHSTIYE